MPIAASSAEGRAASNAAEKACAEDAKANIQFLRLRRDAVMILTAVIFEFTMPIAASSAEGRAASNDAEKKAGFPVFKESLRRCKGMYSVFEAVKGCGDLSAAVYKL